MTITQRRILHNEAADEAAFWGDDDSPVCACGHHTHLGALAPCDTPGCKCQALSVTPAAPVGPTLVDIRTALLGLLTEARDEAEIAVGALTGLDCRAGASDAVWCLTRVISKLGAAVHVAGKIG